MTLGVHLQCVSNGLLTDCSAHIGPLQLLVQAQRGVLASSIEKQIPSFKQGEQVHCENK